MKYRPEGFKNPYEDDKHVFDQEYNDFEDGADAMLEGLRKRSFTAKEMRENVALNWGGDEVVMVKPPRENGWLVFIPEEVTPSQQ